MMLLYHLQLGVRHIPVIGLLIALCFVTGGCAELQTLNPFATKSDVVPGVMPPRDRLKVLRDKAENAHLLSPAEQRDMAADLARSFRREDDPHMRRLILVTLSHYPGNDYDSVLREAAGDPDRHIRAEAARLWGEQGGPEAAQRLRTLSQNDPEMDVRLAAVRALGSLRGPEAVQTLSMILDDRDPTLQGVAMDSLAECTDQDFGGDVHRWRRYVRGETPGPAKEISIAERLRSLSPL